MNELREACIYCKENKKWTLKVFVVTVCAMGVGAYVGTLAYYNGWLG